jgi:hypothetical protein
MVLKNRRLTVDQYKESAMFVKERREPFILPSEFRAKTTVDVAEINDASIEKNTEHMEGSGRIQIGDHHDVATVENEYILNFSLGGDTEKVSSGAALDDLVVAEIKDSDNNPKDNDELKLGQKPFLGNLIDFKNKKVLVRACQRESTRGKCYCF